MPAKKPRTRGAQPSNVNSITHGIYSKRFTDDELTRIISAMTDPAASVSALIESSAVLVDRILERLSPPATPPDLETFLQLISAHNETAGRIANLARTKQILSGDAADNIAQHIAGVLDALSNIHNTQL
jgi:hypothetical protein